ncbi:hypothetical protein HELRODRAFT_81043 [Helobdella robusta]|uniref:PRA1 family protein n=1 Tax=Helobdella robusta TaxID=6412 RepID=T1G482_HELRO|nr:hypothetical protein HELRODRAFT_81043 [Helobdella robusta]ESO02927.1 hypothetical protein HELRODRAFT_81043 [Helobdella robusta]
MSSKVDFAPFQPLDEFLLDLSRFQAPNFRNIDKWTNRIINNLLYFQTNYFVMALIIFTLIGIYHPVDMIVGCLTLAGAITIFITISNMKQELKRFKKNYPIVGVLCIIALCYFFIYVLGSVAVFCFGIAFPLFIILLHASFRLRSLKNKMSNKMEYVGLKRTPMGLLLEGIGLEEQAAS